MDMGSPKDYLYIPIKTPISSSSSYYVKNNPHSLVSVSIKSDKDKYREGQENCGWNIGDTVRITRKALTNEAGWKNDWVSNMDVWVGKTATIIAFYDTFGIELENKEISEYGYAFPYFVLELVGQSSTESLMRENELLKEQVNALRETISPDDILSNIYALENSELLTSALKKKVKNLDLSITQFIYGEGSRKKLLKMLDKEKQKVAILEMQITRMTLKLSRWQKFLEQAIEAKRELNRLKRKGSENG